jgi:hypothetical protein
MLETVKSLGQFDLQYEFKNQILHTKSRRQFFETSPIHWHSMTTMMSCISLSHTFSIFTKNGNLVNNWWIELGQNIANEGPEHWASPGIVHESRLVRALRNFQWFSNLFSLSCSIIANFWAFFSNKSKRLESATKRASNGCYCTFPRKRFIKMRRNDASKFGVSLFVQRLSVMDLTKILWYSRWISLSAILKTHNESIFIDF